MGSLAGKGLSACMIAGGRGPTLGFIKVKNPFGNLRPALNNRCFYLAIQVSQGRGEQSERFTGQPLLWPLSEITAQWTRQYISLHCPPFLHLSFLCPLGIYFFLSMLILLHFLLFCPFIICRSLCFCNYYICLSFSFPSLSFGVISHFILRLSHCCIFATSLALKNNSLRLSLTPLCHMMWCLSLINVFFPQAYAPSVFNASHLHKIGFMSLCCMRVKSSRFILSLCM